MQRIVLPKRNVDSCATNLDQERLYFPIYFPFIVTHFSTIFSYFLPYFYINRYVLLFYFRLKNNLYSPHYESLGLYVDPHFRKLHSRTWEKRYEFLNFNLILFINLQFLLWILYYFLWILYRCIYEFRIEYYSSHIPFSLIIFMILFKDLRCFEWKIHKIIRLEVQLSYRLHHFLFHFSPTLVHSCS